MVNNRSDDVGLTIDVWIFTLNNIISRVDSVISALQPGSLGVAAIRACDAYDYVYRVLVREPDPIYDSLKTYIAYAAATLRELCAGDERQRPLPSPQRR
jgi:hypothetical protein